MTPPTAVETQDFKVADLSLAAYGRKEIELAEHEMPGLMQTRAEFAAWCDGVCERHGYTATRSGIGPDDEELGAPTQMAVFRR